ncbi:MAG: hypothetical protein ACRC20_12680 [Segniliparus sp.]|uniref:hypothetical protein n=1 Tax=Segniliparus sp. TaxID=2804064 RepID=UPI003F39AAA0
MANQIRAEFRRLGKPVSGLFGVLGSRNYVDQRLGKHVRRALTLSELEQLSDILGMSPLVLLRRAMENMSADSLSALRTPGVLVEIGHGGTQAETEWTAREYPTRYSKGGEDELGE